MVKYPSNSFTPPCNLTSMEDKEETFKNSLSYAESFRTFSDHSTYHRSLKALLDHEVIPNSTHLLQGDRIDILTLGAGTGVPDAMLLEVINRNISSKEAKLSISYTIVEPNREFIKTLKHKENLWKAMYEYIDVNFIYRQANGEDFLEKTTDQTFDLILFFHSLYFMDAEEVLPTCIHLLSPKGRLVILMETEQSFTTKFGPHIRRFQDKSRLSKEAAPLTIFKSAEDITSTIRKLDRKVITATNDYYTDLSECFVSNSTDGSKLIDFFALTEDTRNKYEKEVWDSILKFVVDNSKEDSKGRKITTSSQTMFVLCNEDVDV